MAREVIAPRKVLRADATIVRLQCGRFHGLRWRRRWGVLEVGDAEHRRHVWRWHWEHRIDARRVALTVVRIVRVQVVQDLHLTGVIVGVVEVTAQEFRSRETLPAQAAVVALLRRKVLERRIVDARMQIIHVARQVILFREGFVTQHAHRSLLAVDDDV